MRGVMCNSNIYIYIAYILHLTSYILHLTSYDLMEIWRRQAGESESLSLWQLKLVSGWS